MTLSKRILRLSLQIILTLAGLFVTVWGALAMFYRLQFPEMANILLIGLWCLAGLVLLAVLWRKRLLWALFGYLALLTVLLSWWNTLLPSNFRAWADDVAQMTHGEIRGDHLTLHNVRNFNWRSDTDYDIAWETREYDLSKLSSVDMLTSNWGIKPISHVLVSFGFDDGRFLTFTVEIRKEQHETYSSIGGFFKEFELSILATDERDAIRVRSNVRGEDVHLYRVTIPREDIRALLVAYIEQANELTTEPRFYNTITANCTTIVFHMMRNIIGALPVDYRLILTGYLPAYVQSVGGLEKGYSLDELTRLGDITERAKAADQAADFSIRIRQGVPGWQPLALPQAE